MLHRFCLTTLSKSRIVFTGECASTPYNTALMRLLVEEFHRQSAPTELPVATSLSAPPRSAAGDVKARMMMTTTKATGREDSHGSSAGGAVMANRYVIAFLATQAEVEANLDATRQQLQNMASSGVCSVAVLIAPDLAANRAAISHLEAIPDVKVIDINDRVAELSAWLPAASAAQPPAGGNESEMFAPPSPTTGSGEQGQTPSPSSAALDDAAGMPCTPRQWAAAVSGELWLFVARSRIACGKRSVWCWGDSLTEGYTYKRGRLTFAPYTEHLAAHVLPNRGAPADDAATPPAFAIPCINRGVSGELTLQIRNRFEDEAACSGRTPRNGAAIMRAGDVAVIFAGTNDLGSGLTPAEALENVKAMVDQAVDAIGMRVVLVSIPSTAMAQKNELYLARQEYNAGLRALVESTNARKGGSCGTVARFVDFFATSSTPTSADPTVLRLRPDIAVDNLHLSAEGYQLLAEEIGAAVRLLLCEQ